MLTIKILANGDLSVKAVDSSEVLEMLENERPHDLIMSDLIESHSTNGSFFAFIASDIGHMSDAPMIGESALHSDAGIIGVIGKSWFYAPYNTTLETEELAEGNEVIYTLLK